MRPDISRDDQETISVVKAYTMTSDERLLALIDAVRHIHRHSVPGSIVECGVWRGGSCMAALLTLLKLRSTNRDVFLYDTYEGMPAPTDADRSFNGESAQAQLAVAPAGTGIWCHAGIDDVKRNVFSTKYPVERLHFIEGKVEETIPGVLPNQIAILRLDTDWYESTRHELIHLYPRLVPGGIIIIDDYGHWQGCRKAVDEFLLNSNHQLFLSRIDYTGRIGVKLEA